MGVRRKAVDIVLGDHTNTLTFAHTPSFNIFFEFLYRMSLEFVQDKRTFRDFLKENHVVPRGPVRKDVCKAVDTCLTGDRLSDSGRRRDFPVKFASGRMSRQTF